MPACMTPFSVDNRKPGGTKTIPVPCGRCPICVARKVSAWSFRLMQEAKVSLSAFFVTLTYNTDHVPFSKNGFMTLNKPDLQKFFKRLRYEHTQRYSIGDAQMLTKSLKYYAVGEYGTKNKRPHYHLLLFNADANLIESAWRLDGRTIGDIHMGDVSGASVGYSLKYMSKQWRPMHRNDDRTPQFAVMSKGLGASYLSDAMIKWHLADLENRMYVNVEGGKKVSMPRYYKDRIYTETERCIAAFHSRVNMIARDHDKKESQSDEIARHIAEFQRMHINADKNKTL